MKKLLFLIQIIALAALYSSSSYASGGHGRSHGRGHHKHHRPPERHNYHEEIRNYPQPAARYYPEPPRQYDQRSTSGLVGGAVGSALGYEIGKGDPVASGLGAAAGAYIGNDMNRR